MKHNQLVELYNRLTSISTDLFDLSGMADYGYDGFTGTLLTLVNETFEAVEKARREAYRLRSITTAVPPTVPSGPVVRESYGPDEAPF